VTVAFSLVALAIYFWALVRVLHGPTCALGREDWDPDGMSEGWLQDRARQVRAVQP
jgi:hypothetical protein